MATKNSAKSIVRKSKRGASKNSKNLWTRSALIDLSDRKRAEQELKAEIAVRKQTEETLRKLTHDLNKRIQEINCLYSTCYQVEKQSIQLEERIQGIVSLLPSGWQYPEIASARITLDQEEYRTDNFRETPWKQVSEIIVDDAKIGRVEICYLEEKPMAHEGPFLKEEQGLIDTIAIELGEMIGRARADRALRDASLYARTLIEASLDPMVTIDRDGRIMDVNKATELVTGATRETLIGSDFSYYFTEPEKARKGYQLVFYNGFVRDYPLAIRHTTGRVTDVLYNATLYRNETGEIQGIFAAARDITEHKEVENQIYATNALLNLFSKKETRSEYLDEVVSLLQNWTGCCCIGIRALDKKGFIPYESYVGFSREFWESENWLSVEQHQCACIRVVTGKPDPQDASVMSSAGSFVCNNTIEFIKKLSEEEKTRFRGVCVLNGFLSVAVIPISYRGRILGAIHVADEKEGMVPAKTVEFMESMAPLIGEAVNRFNLEDELRESEKRLRLLSSELLSIQENERRRIALEVHDSLGQSLNAIKFKVENTLHEMEKRNDPSTRSIRELIPVIQESIDEARRLQMDLRPPMLDDLGIMATFSWFCRQFQKTYADIQIEIQTNIDEDAVPKPLNIAIYRILQEAMNNIAKHSKASLVSLSLKKGDGRIALMIQDNGQGFDLSGKASVEWPGRGLGLTSMQERAKLSGGFFSIESVKNKGTTIQVSWSV